MTLLSFSCFSQSYEIGRFYDSQPFYTNSYEFNESELIIKTDSFFNYGFQYITYYAIEPLNDTFFQLSIKEQYGVNNNNLEAKPEPVKIDASPNLVLNCLEYPFWKFQKLDNGEIKLTGNESLKSGIGKKTESTLTLDQPSNW